MRKGIGILFMLLGVAMVLCAGWLVMENRTEEQRAGESASQIFEQVLVAVEDGKTAAQPEAAAYDSSKSPDIPDAEAAVYIGSASHDLTANEVIEGAIQEMPAEVPAQIEAGMTTGSVLGTDENPIGIPGALPQTKTESGFSGEMPVVEIEGNEYIGYLELPTILLSLPVMSDWSYPQLRIAPCRYSGSAYDDTMVVMAHNYDRHFGSLRSLQEGDPVQFVDMQGNIFRYEVACHELLQKGDVSEMVDNEWDLTLFSCTYGGEARVTVRLNRVKAYQ